MRPLLMLPFLVTGTMILANQSAAATVNFAGFNGGNDLTVVEADEFDIAGSAGNTVFADAGNTGGTTTQTQGSFSDADTWKFRPSSGSNEWSAVPNEFTGVYSSFGNGATDNAALTVTTTVNGLDSNTYNIYAIYVAVNSTNADGGIAAALSGETLVDYPDVAGSSGGAGSISLEVTGDDPVWEAYAVQIGTVTGTGFAVDAGLLSSTDTGSGIQRNLYVGVGYQIVPEPGSLALLGLGGLTMLRRRRS